MLVPLHFSSLAALAPRNAIIPGSGTPTRFHLLGENGVVSWGYTADFPDAQRAVPIPAGQGPDARDGNHPQGNVLEGNFFHEIGHFQKQVREGSADARFLVRRPARTEVLTPGLTAVG